MRFSDKTEVTEYRNTYIRTTWRESKGSLVGTIMSVAFSDQDCHVPVTDAKDRIISNFGSSKERTISEVQKKLDKKFLST